MFPLFDVSLLSIANELRSPALDFSFALLTWFGSLWLLVPLSELLILGWRGRDRFAAWQVALSLLLASGLAYLVKYLVGRERPDLFLPLVAMPADAAFPSAHSAQVAAWALAVFLIVPPRWRWKVGSGLALLVLGVGFSRIYLQVHWPTDVLAGYFSGVLAVLLVVALRRLLAPN
jgi:undecaprenyl-diphosphatase